MSLSYIRTSWILGYSVQNATRFSSGDVFCNLVIECVLQYRLVNEYQQKPSHTHPLHLKLVLYADFSLHIVHAILK